jgi:uncharacterized membrane protein YkoI
MTRVFGVVAAAVGLAVLGVAAVSRAGGEGEGDRAALVGAFSKATVPLAKGVAAAGAAQGTPISAKYEVEDGKLQLSVYTARGGGFLEVIVDHATGKIAKSEAITSGEDLQAAKAQEQAMATAKRPIGAAIEEAVKQSPGYRAVSATPRLEGGRAVAAVTLLKGSEWKTVVEPLDERR